MLRRYTIASVRHLFLLGMIGGRRDFREQDGGYIYLPDSDRQSCVETYTQLFTVTHMTFRFAAKYGLLTYSQAPDLDPLEIVNLLGDLGAECIVGRENHQDGGTHYHAFFMFAREFRTRNARIFDCGGYHPNILRGRKTPRAMYEYATKDGDICGGGLEAPEDEPRTSSSDDFWAAVFAAEGREETFRIAKETNVGLFGRYYFQVRAIGEGKAIKNPLDYISPASLEFSTSSYPELEDWCQTYLGRRGGR